MTADSLTRQWFTEVWNDKNEETIDRMLAPDAIVHGLGGPGAPPMIGPAAFKQVFHTFHGAFDDLTITIERTFVDGDVCTAYCRVQGRHTGDTLGPSTGRQVDFHGVTITRTGDGKLLEGWNVFDFLTMYQQLGWVPSPVVPVV